MRYSEGLDTTGVSDLASAKVTREQGPIRALVSFSPREPCAPALPEHAQSTTFVLLVEASPFRLTGWIHIHLFLLSTTYVLLVEAGLFRLTGWFHIHLFYLSKDSPNYLFMACEVI